MLHLCCQLTVEQRTKDESIKRCVIWQSKHLRRLQKGLEDDSENLFPDGCRFGVQERMSSVAIVVCCPQEASIDA